MLFEKKTSQRKVFKVWVAISALLIFLTIPSGTALAASPCNKKNPTADSLNACLNENPIVKDIRTITKVLAAGVGVVITGSIIVGGIQYAAAGGNPNAVTAAKQRISNSLIALLTFMFIMAFLEWIIPGGLVLNK